jgi:hypothetical protein
MGEVSVPRRWIRAALAVGVLVTGWIAVPAAPAQSQGSGLVVTPTSIDFGVGEVSLNGFRTVWVRNDSPSSIEIDVSFDGPDASAYDTTGCLYGLDAGEQCPLDIWWEVTRTGDFSARASVTGGPGLEATVELSGVGVLTGMAASPPMVEFGPVAPGTVSETRRVLVSGTGGTGISISPLELEGSGGDQFEIVDQDCSLLPVMPDQACYIDVVYAPSRAGDASADIVVGFSRGGQAATDRIPLSGRSALEVDGARSGSARRAPSPDGGPPAAPRFLG